MTGEEVTQSLVDHDSSTPRHLLYQRQVKIRIRCLNHGTILTQLRILILTSPLSMLNGDLAFSVKCNRLCWNGCVCVSSNIKVKDVLQ